MRGLPRLPSMRVHQRGLFAADVRAGALVHVDVDASCRVPIAFVPRMPAAYASLSAVFHPRDRLRELAADVDVARLGADRVGADRAPLDEGVRRPAHDLAILERARLRLVGVAAEVVRLAVAGLHERPLHAGREAGAAAAAQPRVLDDVHDLRPGAIASAFSQRLVAAALLPAVERARLGVSEVLREHRRLASDGACADIPFSDQMTDAEVHECSFQLARMADLLRGHRSRGSPSLIMTGVAKPQAPRHSTSITVYLPSGDVTPSSSQPGVLEERLDARPRRRTRRTATSCTPG